MARQFCFVGTALATAEFLCELRAVLGVLKGLKPVSVAHGKKQKTLIAEHAEKIAQRPQRKAMSLRSGWDEPPEVCLRLWGRPESTPCRAADKPAPPLGGVLGKFGQMFAVSLRRCDDFHFFPVIGKFSATVETSHIRSGQGRRLRASRRSANGYWKTVARMPAAEKRIHQFGNHGSTFHMRAGWLAPWITPNDNAGRQLLMKMRDDSWVNLHLNIPRRFSR